MIQKNTRKYSIECQTSMVTLFFLVQQSQCDASRIILHWVLWIEPSNVVFIGKRARDTVCSKYQQVCCNRTVQSWHSHSNNNNNHNGEKTNGAHISQNHFKTFKSYICLNMGMCAALYSVSLYATITLCCEVNIERVENHLCFVYNTHS